jgi:hypothetical protein
MQNPKIYKIHTKACSPLGKFFCAMQSEKIRRKKSWISSYFFTVRANKFA